MSKPFSFFVITDPHYFELSLGGSGEAYEARSLTDQKCVAETGAILDATVEKLITDEETDTILIPGDLVYRGETESHKGFRKRLEKLEEHGKKSYVITARHDYSDNPRGFRGNECFEVEGMPREELRDFYYHHGFEQAISEHKSMSYVVQLADGIRLLALNCDGDCGDFKGIWDDQMEWALEQIKAAHDSGNYIFAMTHYPLLPYSPIMNMIGDAKLTDWKKVATTFADAGLDLIFTGHMHSQAVTEFITEKGNKITDVQTGSLVGCPAYYRRVTFLDNNTIDIKSYPTPEFEFVDKTKMNMTAEEYFEWRFNRMIIWKMGKVIPAKVNKIIDKMTLKKIAKLLCIKIDDSLKDRLAKDVAIEFVRNIFVGNEPYTKGTPMYEALDKALGRLKPVLKIAQKKLAPKNEIFSDIKGFVLTTIGDEKKRDHNTVLDIKWKR